MVIEIIVHDSEYPNGNSWKYGFSNVDEAVKFLKKDRNHLQKLCGLTPRAADGEPAKYIYCECPSCHATGLPELFIRRR